MKDKECMYGCLDFFECEKGKPYPKAKCLDINPKPGYVPQEYEDAKKTIDWEKLNEGF